MVGLPLTGAAALEAELLVGMNGAEPAELGAGAEVLRRPAVDGGDLGERRAAAFAAGTGLAVHLVAGAEAVVADDLLADVDVAVGGQVARLATPEEARAPPGDLQDAEHQAPAATERLIRWRIAVSPWVLVMPRVSLSPS